MTTDQWRVPLSVIAGLVAINFADEMAAIIIKAVSVPSIPFLRSYLSYGIGIGAMFVALRLIGGVALTTQWRAIGLNQPWRSSALLAASLFIPAIVILFMLGQWSKDATVANLVFGGLAAPLAEEITFRGLASGILLLVAGWRFWWAALFPAAVFGLMHAWQGQSVSEIGGIVGVTAVGGLFFSWLYKQFGHNLWPAFAVHAGLNLCWSMFELGENAVGSWTGNILRFMVVVGAILLALGRVDKRLQPET